MDMELELKSLLLTPGARNTPKAAPFCTCQMCGVGPGHSEQLHVQLFPVTSDPLYLKFCGSCCCSI